MSIIPQWESSDSDDEDFKKAIQLSLDSEPSKSEPKVFLGRSGSKLIVVEDSDDDWIDSKPVPEHPDSYREPELSDDDQDDELKKAIQMSLQQSTPAQASPSCTPAFSDSWFYFAEIYKSDCVLVLASLSI
jgi:hypothetical protein